MTTRITMDEWLAAIQAPAAGYTDTELANALGYAVAHYRNWIRPKLLKAGAIQQVGIRRIGSAKAKTYELITPNRDSKAVLDVGLAVLLDRARGGRNDPPPPPAQKKRPKR